MTNLALFDPPRLHEGIELFEAQQLWREWSCEEFTGGKHPYELVIEEGKVQLGCAVCGRDPLPGDFYELLYFGPIPVEVSIQNIKYDVPGEPIEYDVEIEVTPR